ncbi:8168_t:CDS:2, partial [Gigaspora margarita]
LERLVKENEKRFAKLEQNQNNAVDKLENGDNSSKNDVNISDPVINQCIDTNFKSLKKLINEQDNSIVDFQTECQKVIGVKNLHVHVTEIFQENNQDLKKFSETKASVSSPDTKTNRFNEFPRLELYFSINAEGEHQIDSYYIFGSQICPICEKKHWYLNGKWWTNEGNKFYYLVCDNSNEPGVPFEEIIKVLPKEYTSSVSCPICNKKENIRDNIEGKWGCSDYVNTKTYCLKCWEAYQNEIQIVTVKA